MKEGIGKLYTNDYIKNIINVIGIAIAVPLYNLVTVAGFDVFKLDFVVVSHQIINIALIAVVVDITRRFGTTTKGSFIGITPEDK